MSPHWMRVIEEKGNRRLILAAMPPQKAQDFVSSLPANGGAWRDVTPNDRWQLGFPEGEGAGLNTS